MLREDGWGCARSKQDKSGFLRASLWMCSGNGKRLNGCTHASLPWVGGHRLVRGKVRKTPGYLNAWRVLHRYDTIRPGVNWREIKRTLQRAYFSLEHAVKRDGLPRPTLDAPKTMSRPHVTIHRLILSAENNLSNKECDLYNIIHCLDLFPSGGDIELRCPTIPFLCYPKLHSLSSHSC